MKRVRFEGVEMEVRQIAPRTEIIDLDPEGDDEMPALMAEETTEDPALQCDLSSDEEGENALFDQRLDVQQMLNDEIHGVQPRVHRSFHGADMFEVSSEEDVEDEDEAEAADSGAASLSQPSFALQGGSTFQARIDTVFSGLAHSSATPPISSSASSAFASMLKQTDSFKEIGLPAHRVFPDKYTHYSLEDVDAAGTDNKQVAFEFLSDLRNRNLSTTDTTRTSEPPTQMDTSATILSPHTATYTPLSTAFRHTNVRVMGEEAAITGSRPMTRKPNVTLPANNIPSTSSLVSSRHKDTGLRSFATTGLDDDEEEEHAHAHTHAHTQTYRRVPAGGDSIHTNHSDISANRTEERASSQDTKMDTNDPVAVTFKKRSAKPKPNIRRPETE